MGTSSYEGRLTRLRGLHRSPKDHNVTCDEMWGVVREMYILKQTCLRLPTYHLDRELVGDFVCLSNGIWPLTLDPNGTWGVLDRSV